MTVSDGAQATQLTRCHPGSLSHPVFLFLAQPHDDVQVPHFSSILEGPRQISAGPGWSTPEEVEPNFLFCKQNFLFRFDSIDRDHERHAGVGDSLHRDVQEDYREVQSLQLLDHYLAHPNRRQRGSKTKLLLFFSLLALNQTAPNRKRKSNARVKHIQGWSGGGVSS